MNRLLRLFCCTCVLITCCYFVSAQGLLLHDTVIVRTGEPTYYFVPDDIYLLGNNNNIEVKGSFFYIPVTSFVEFDVYKVDTIDLIRNGNFNSGNKDFYSEYIYCPDPDISFANPSDSLSLWQGGRYTVDDNPNEYHANLLNCNGHTGNDPDNYLMANTSGSIASDSLVLWGQTLDVIPDKFYERSLWTCDIDPNSGGTCNWRQETSLHVFADPTIDFEVFYIRPGINAMDDISLHPLDFLGILRRTFITFDLGADREICQGDTITLDAGIAGLEYKWNTGETSQTIRVSETGDYSVEVRNANSLARDDVNVTVHPGPTVDLGADREICPGDTISLDAGNAGSRYLWRTGERSQTIRVSEVKRYSVKVTDANGCSARDAVFVKVYPNSTVDLGADREICEGERFFPHRDRPGSTYLWSTGETGRTIRVSETGVYSITKYTNSCSASDSVNLTVLPIPVVDLGADREICPRDTISLDAGNAGSTYLWRTGETSQTIRVSETGVYSVMVTGTNKCSASDSVNLTVLPSPVVDLGADREICPGDTISLDAGNAGSTYLWRTGETSQTIRVSETGVYSVMVTGANKCSARDSVNVTVHPNPTVDLGADWEICLGKTISLDAGNAGSIYSWSTGDISQTIRVSETGVYSVMVTGANKCSARDSVNVTVHPNPTVDLGADQEICLGDTISLNAGNPGSRYLWSTGETGQIIRVSETGVYSVMVIGVNDCSAIDSVDVTVRTGPTVDLGADQEICLGDTISLNAGNPGSRYLWRTGETSQTIRVSETGVYSVMVTGANKCSARDSVNVTVHPNPTVDLGADQEICLGDTISLNAGNPGSRYLWSTGETGQIIRVSETGVYSVMVTGVNDCSSIDSVDVTVHPGPTVDLGADQEICLGDTISLNAGNPGSRYLWSTGETSQTIRVSEIKRYLVMVTDANGCSARDAVFVKVYPNSTVNLGADREICEGRSFSPQGDLPGSTYLWSTGDTTRTIRVSETGVYSVTKYTNSCSASDSVNLTVLPIPVVDLGADREICTGEETILDAGNPGLTYWWTVRSNGERITAQTITISNSEDIMYLFLPIGVLVTDTNNCSGFDVVNIIGSLAPIVDLGADQEICAGDTISLNAGNSGSTYLWSTGETSQTIRVSETGVYSVMVTGVNDCSTIDSVDITVHPSLTVDLGADREICPGDTISLNAGNPGSRYLWSTGETSQTIRVSEIKRYSVMVTDANGCSTRESVNVTIHSNPTVDLGADQEICLGDTISLNAGNPGSRYLWSTGETSQTIRVSETGDYSVMVTDVNYCSTVDSVDVTVNLNPTVDLGSGREICAGDTISLNAGNSGSTYLWSTGETSQTIRVSETGVYSVMVTGVNDCSTIDSVDVTVHPSLTVDLGADREICPGDIISLDAGNARSRYLWRTGERSQTIRVSEIKRYSVMVTDANGCSAIDSVDVTVHPSPTVDLGADREICPGDTIGLDAGNAGSRYLWSTGETSQTIRVSEIKRYSVMVTDANGCSARDAVFVKVYPNSTVDLGADREICAGDTISLDAGNAGSIYSWSTGDTTQIIIVSETGVYSVTKYTNSCSASDSVNLTVLPIPVVDLGADREICTGEETILDAGNAGSIYSWSTGETSQTIRVSEAGVYSVMVTDVDGCSTRESVNVIIHPSPTVDLGADREICVGDTISLDAGNSGLEYSWSTGETSQTIRVSEAGNYSVMKTDLNNCFARDDANITFHPEVDLGADRETCSGDTITLDAGNAGSIYSWSTGETSQTIRVSETGVYSVMVTGANECSESDNVSVRSSPNPIVDLGADREIFGNEIITLDAGSGYSSYHWSTGSNRRSIEIGDAGDYSVEVENEYGCIARASITVKQQETRMLVPNVFTPNGKGANKIFYPVFKGAVINFEMYIYSRWGEQVFEIKKDMLADNELKYEGWDGTYKGKDAETGVYVWLIFYEGKERARGTVTLLR